MTTGTVVKVNRNEHDCKNFEKFVLFGFGFGFGGSWVCTVSALEKKSSIYFKDKSKEQETAEVLYAINSSYR